MTKAPISLQDLRRSLYVKAKAEPAWRFWGLYVHICKMETLREAWAGLDLHSGRVIETISDTHKSADFIAFLKKLEDAFMLSAGEGGTNVNRLKL